jgi:hypothetical protein
MHVDVEKDCRRPHLGRKGSATRERMRIGGQRGIGLLATRTTVGVGKNFCGRLDSHLRLGWGERNGQRDTTWMWTEGPVDRDGSVAVSHECSLHTSFRLNSEWVAISLKFRPDSPDCDPVAQVAQLRPIAKSTPYHHHATVKACVLDPAH